MKKLFWGFLRILVVSLLIFVFSPAAIEVYANNTKSTAEVYVAGNPDYYPFEYFDKKDRMYKGIVPDLLQIVSEKTGIHFIYMDENVNLEDLVENLQIDMISSFQYNQEQIEAYNLTLGEKIFSFTSEQDEKRIFLAFTTVADSETASLINEALRSITNEQKEQILLSKVPTELSAVNGRADSIIMALLFISTALLIIMIFFVHKYKKRLIKQIHTDRISGYGNHIQLFEDYAVFITDSNRCNYSVINLKIENFSYISEVHGYVERDNTLTQISFVIQSHLSEQEMFARITEGSFILVMQYLSQQQLTKKLEQICLAIENMMNQESADYVPSLKSGIYFLNNLDNDLNIAINNAIQARRYAQNNSLSYAVYDESKFNSINLIKELDHEVIIGLENNEFIPYFQPKLALDSLEIVGFEALLRWNSKKKGLLFPSQFIPILEKNGLLGEVDIALFQNVCQLLGQRVNEGREIPHISCNFSKSSFSHPNFCQTLKKIAHEQQVPASYLEIEISDTISAEIINTIDTLKSYGFTVALDNFGGEHSTIIDLQNCSIDTLKLDKEIIKDMNNPKTKSILESVVEMCHDFGVKVASQGVENEEQLQLLKQVNCDYAQGYIFYQPMPYSELDKLIKTIQKSR